jgi:hypothetical protein
MRRSRQEASDLNHLASATLSLALLASPAIAQTNNSPWVNHYPTDQIDGVNGFFNTPWISELLDKILSPTDLKLLADTYSRDALIREVDDWLVIDNCMPRECGTHAFAFVDTTSPNIVVVFRDAVPISDPKLIASDPMQSSQYSLVTRVYGTEDLSQLPSDLVERVFSDGLVLLSSKPPQG